MHYPFLRLLFPIVFLLSLSAITTAQRPSIEDFTMFGDTYRTEDDCFRLTEEEDYSSGSIWYKRPISLSAPFSIELSILAGCKDGDGADGMVFVFTSRANTVGYRGEGIGFGGLRPYYERLVGGVWVGASAGQMVCGYPASSPALA